MIDDICSETYKVESVRMFLSILAVRIWYIKFLQSKHSVKQKRASVCGYQKNKGEINHVLLSM